MKVTFEIKTTCSKPFYITVCEETPMFEVRKIIMSEIDYHTILMRDDVIDLFIPDGHDCVSIPEITSDTVSTFINRYPKHFDADKNSLCSNFHQLFVMDQTYLDKIRSKSEAPIYKDVIPPTEKSTLKNVFNVAVAMFTGIHIK